MTDKQIYELPAAGSASATDQIAIDNAANNTQKITISQILTYIQGALTQALRLNVTNGTPPVNGLYLPVSNRPGVTSNSLDVMQFRSTGTAVNYLLSTSEATGVAPSVAAVSATDANVILQLKGQGNKGAEVEGTATNDSATAGYVGEYMSSTVSSGSAISLTDDTSVNVTSITLTPGDWDVSANGFLLGNAATNLFDARFSLSTTTNTLDSSLDRLSWYVQNTTIFGNGADVSVPIPPARFSVAVDTTVYLVARGNFATNTMSAYGMIRARRVR